ncbi:hybrid sensor histidine kinase/response regulator [Bacteroidia bacterium]|nr:hybrid sensor histidine kinase/response regulator [Bacteroidia bacterium]
MFASLAAGSSRGRGTDNIRFENLEPTRSLSNKGVNHIMQDSRGYIWISTQEGLNCYNSYTVRQFLNNFDDSTSLTHNYVRSTFEDSAGRLWVCTEIGICRYDRERECFVRYHIDSGSRSSTGCHAVVELADGTITIALGGRLHRYDRPSESFVPMEEFSWPSMPPGRINAFCDDGHGTLWMATDMGIRCLDLQKRRIIIPAMSGPGSDLVCSTGMVALGLDSARRIWMAGWPGLFVYDPGRGAITTVVASPGLRANLFRTIGFDSFGNTWAGGENGIYIIDGQLQVQRHITCDINDITNINDNAVYSVCRDRSDNMWVGTYFGGVNVMYHRTTAFTIYPHGYSQRHLSGNAVRQIIEQAPHSLWIATEDGGLDLLDRRTGQFTRYTTRPDSRIPLSYHNVHSLLIDRKRRLWIGTFSGGITLHDLRTGRTTYPKCVNGNTEASGIFSLLEDPEGNVWIGTIRGLFVAPEGDVGRIQFVNGRFAYCMAYDTARQALYIGTRRNGIVRYDPRTGHQSEIAGENIYQNFVTSLLVDSHGNLWAGTNEGGIRFLPPDGGPERSYTTRDGLPSNSIKAMVEDADGAMWITTSRGLSRFDPASGRFQDLSSSDGVPDCQFNYTSAFRASDGELFFGTTQGMISMRPAIHTADVEPLRVELIDFRINGQQTPSIGTKGSPLRRSIAESNHITLSHRQAQVLRFAFTTLNFGQAGDIRYAIKMENADNDWHDVGNQHQVIYSNLPHGRYRLGIRASYDGLHWDQAGARYLTVDIRPPLWLQWWAWTIYVALAAAMGYLVFLIIRARIILQRRIDVESAAKENAEQLNHHKMTLFTNISHDLKTPLTLIVGPLQKIVAERQNDAGLRSKVGVVLRNAQRMRNLLEEMVMLGKIEMGYMKVTVQQGDVLAFIDRICDIFRIFAADNDINLIVNIDTRHREVWFSTVNLERIVYNLVSNAFKYTSSGGSIRVKAYLTRDDEGRDILSLSVKDNGAGIPQQQQKKIFDNYYSFEHSGIPTGTGIGLALTRSLVQLHHGAISVHSTVGEGSIFTVKIDVDRRSYTPEQTTEIKVESAEAVNERFILENNEYLREARVETQAGENSRQTLLVVEDNSELCDFVRQIFEADYHVVTAPDGEAGLEAAAGAMPDIIVSDVMMPGMDGFEMTRRLKSDLTTSHIPIVLLTAKTHEQDKIEGFGVGADAYISKPFNNQRLELQVRNLLATRRSNILHFRHNEQSDVQRLARNPRDEKLLRDLVGLIEANIDNDNFSVAELTVGLGVSRSLLHMKLKKLADMSASEFIRTIKMKKAREHLVQGMNVSEASFAVGISDPNYFTKCFKKQFGQTPTEFLKSIRQGALT